MTTTTNWRRRKHAREAAAARKLRRSARIRGKPGRPRGRSQHYVAHVRRPSLTPTQAVHVTLRVVEGAPSLRRPRARAVIERVFGAERCAKGFRLVHYSIRSNHLHLICEANDAQALSRGIQRLASRLARRLNGAFGREGRLFADRFHGRAFGSPRAARRVLRYVLCNHHKDAARTGVPVTGIDPYSSGHHFDGWADVEPKPPPRAPPPVTPARSWLLRIGWRREGLIRSDEYAALLLPW